MNKLWIQVRSGGRFYPLSPKAEEVHLEDIAHALSQLCRFTGHSQYLYSVGQHCVHVSELLEQRSPDDINLALAGLVHDGSEAYIADVSAPLKRSGEFGKYRAAEAEIQRVIHERFGITVTPEIEARVKWADLTMLHTEALSLMAPVAPGWGLEKLPPPREEPINPWIPAQAKARFLERFELLDKRRKEK